MKNCTKCNKSKEDECFIGCGGRQCNQCDRCRELLRKYKSKTRPKCEHGKQTHQCKLCGDPLDVTTKRMMYGSKQADMLSNRFYDLTYDHVSTILSETKQCPYCHTTLQYMERYPNLSSIERIDNTKGHTDNNTIICCVQCNTRRVGNTVITG